MNQLLERLKGDEKHDWSAYSTYDVLSVLFDRVLQDGDRFLLSKGHGPMAYYALLATKGVIPLEELDRFGQFDAVLGHHPDRLLLGYGISSGSLGHGLPMAVGVALAGRRTFVLVGDGELDEGSNWEAIQYVGRARVETLTTIVIDNASATYGWPGGIEERFALEGWRTRRVDGRHHDAIEQALREGDGPRCVVAEVRD